MIAVRRLRPAADGSRPEAARAGRVLLPLGGRGVGDQPPAEPPKPYVIKRGYDFTTQHRGSGQRLRYRTRRTLRYGEVPPSRHGPAQQNLSVSVHPGQDVVPQRFGAQPPCEGCRDGLPGTSSGRAPQRARSPEDGPAAPLAGNRISSRGVLQLTPLWFFPVAFGLYGFASRRPLRHLAAGRAGTLGEAARISIDVAGYWAALVLFPFLVRRRRSSHLVSLAAAAFLDRAALALLRAALPGPLSAGGCGSVPRRAADGFQRPRP